MGGLAKIVGRKEGIGVKKIAVINCMTVAQICTGSGCLRAFQEKSGAFSRYGDEEIQLVAFTICQGCKSSQNPENMLEDKLNRILKTGAETIHFGVCTKKANPETGIKMRCPEIDRMADWFILHQIEVVDGTHG